jgi:DNA-binding transcriptional regulator GbsR (MarR family)
MPQRTAKRRPHGFVEKLAVALERDGFPRIAGRIYALLLISDEEVSLDDIAANLGASKASASANTRLLEERGLIETLSRSGDRRNYYKISDDLFTRTMEQRLARWDRVRAVVDEGIKDTTLSGKARTRLRDFDEASDSLRELMEKALVKMKSRGRN